MNLKIEILRALDGVSGHMFLEPVLQRELQMTLPIAPTRVEFETALRELDGQKFISGINPELGGPVKWAITDKGRAALNNAL